MAGLHGHHANPEHVWLMQGPQSSKAPAMHRAATVLAVVSFLGAAVVYARATVVDSTVAQTASYVATRPTLDVVTAPVQTQSRDVQLPPPVLQRRSGVAEGAPSFPLRAVQLDPVALQESEKRPGAWPLTAVTFLLLPYALAFLRRPRTPTAEWALAAAGDEASNKDAVGALLDLEGANERDAARPTTPAKADDGSVVAEVAKTGAQVVGNLFMVGMAGGLVATTGIIRGLAFIVDQVSGGTSESDAADVEAPKPAAPAVADKAASPAKAVAVEAQPKPKAPEPPAKAPEPAKTPVVPQAKVPPPPPPVAPVVPKVVTRTPPAPKPTTPAKPATPALPVASSSEKSTPTTPASTGASPILQTAQVLLTIGFLVYLDKFIDVQLVSRFGLACPSVVISFWGLFGLLCVVGKALPGATAFISAFCSPATGLFASWLGLTVVPTLMNIVSLPNVFGWEAFRLTLSILVLRQIPLTALVGTLLHRSMDSLPVKVPEPVPDKPTAAQPGPTFLGMAALATWVAVAGMIYVPQYAVPFRFLLYFAALGLSYGTALAVRPWLLARSRPVAWACHPTAVAAAGALGAVRLAGHIGGLPFQQSLQLFQSGALDAAALPELLRPLLFNSALRSPGDLISCLLAPGLIALAVRLYEHRAFLFRTALPLAALSTLYTVGTMTLTAALLQPLGFPKVLAASLLVPPGAAPWALQAAGAWSLGRPSLVAAMAVFSTIVGSWLAPTVCKAIPVQTPEARGLVHGAAAAEAETPKGRPRVDQTAALVGSAVFGTCAALICSLGPFRAYLLQLAAL